MSRKQRLMGFILCLLAGGFCFLVAFMILPVLILKARKFAVLYTLGSLFSVGSFAFLWGPYSLLKHLLSPAVLPYSGLCAVNMAATLYCGMSLHSTILTIVFAGLQILSLAYFVLSYIPGGTAGLMFMGKVARKAATSTIGTIM
ncbi:uncharacterized protein LOC135817691 isoform X2 [Sycon ciliatum]|uniref:uncharacterized protein LOC135817691 isoform X2 n=1 Tax=Sycon ciliatum TaxID=27933 RepID=UPI0031F6978D